MNFEHWQNAELPPLGEGSSGGTLEYWQNAELTVLGIGEIGVGSGALDVTQFGVLVEYKAVGAARVSQFGVLVEYLDNVRLRVSEVYTLVETSLDTSLEVTELYALVEIEELAVFPMATYFDSRRYQIPLRKLPDIVAGYQLDPGNSFWSVVVPEESSNLFENPSLELSTRGFVNGSLTSAELSSEQASRGCRSMKCTPDGVSQGYVYQNFQPVQNGWYTVSLDLWAYAGTLFNITATTSVDVATLVIYPKVTGWQRYSLSFPVTDYPSDLWRVFLRSSANNTVNQVFYTDGWQVENKTYATTYFDGDSQDDSWNPEANGYLWTGLPHGSSSIRSSTVWNGGRIYSLFEADFRTTAIIGLGMTPPEQTQERLIDGREVSTNSLNQPRDFSITGRLINCSNESINGQRQFLIDLLDPSRRNSGKMVLRYQPVDRYGSHFGKALNIPCTYIGGLEGNMVDLFNDQLELKFHTNDGKIYEDFNEVVTLSAETEGLEETIVYRDPATGEMSSLAAVVTGGVVKCCAVMRNGDLVVGGTFTNIGGAPAKRIAVYRFALADWEELGQGIGNGGVLALATAFDGTYESVMLGGSFTIDGNSAPLRRIGEWVITSTGTIFDDILEPGGGLDADVYCITYHPMGWYYIGGNFTTVVVTPPLPVFLNKICRIRPFFETGGNFEPFCHGFGNEIAFDTGAVYAILPLKSPSVLFTGTFMTETTSGLILAGIGQYDPVNFAISKSGSGFERAGLTVPSLPRDIKADQFGVPYIGGYLETGTDIATVYPGIMRFNGQHWMPFFESQYTFPTGVFGFDFDTNGNLILLTQDLTYRSTRVWACHEWNGVSFVAPHMQLRDSTIVFSSDNTVLLAKPSNKLMLIAPNGNPFRFSSYTPHVYVGTAPTSVNFTSLVEDVDSRQTYFFRRMTNRTTGDDIVMNVGNDELSEAKLIEYLFDGLVPRILLNKQMDVTNQLLATSTSYQFKLLPGINHVHVALNELFDIDGFLVTETTCKFLMHYKPAHWSIDAAIQ